MEIKGGWLTNFEDNYFAPCTLFSQVKNESDGTSLTDYILSTAIRFTGIDTNITNIKNNITTIEGNITNILGLKFQTNLNKSELGSIVIGNTVVSGVTGVLPIANGGTGASILSANKLLYSDSSKITTSKHYIDNDKIQINVDSLVEDHNFYVNGNSLFNGQTVFNGQTTFNEYTFFTSRFVINNSENGSTLRFGSSKTSNNEADLRARIRYMFKKSASDSLVNRSQLIFEQNSYDSTTGAKLSYADSFRLPETAADKAGNNTYDIITSKGGTISGNLTLTSTLDLSGATVTGPIRIKSNTDVALSKLGSIAIGPDNGQQIRIDNNEIISVNYDSGTSAYVSSTLYLNTEGEGKVQIGSVGNNLVPSTTKEYNLGASATKWNAAFISGYCNCGALVVGKNKVDGCNATGYGTNALSDLTAIVGRVYFKIIS